ncbi:cupin domain-containing protein [Paenibacillus cremeus]|uniref:Cupin domain-containing protein n=1 Tax=Paenibacillus cremeus TaxID=2163881 RepID=A0A559K5K7_9BACL|nr:cupin domain-containing protein [Paenibacillus cremeus]TVY07383.1 cupin domain-containing protein [Paenibacillus cremeus]
MPAPGFNYASPSALFTFDVNTSPFFKKDANNYINVLGIQQLNTIGNASLLDIYLSAGNVVEPHIHQNSNELVYCVSGSAVVSVINPYTNTLNNYPIQAGQVAMAPQGWLHYEVAQADHTHLIAIFDAPQPDVIFGSDMLRLTPPNVIAYTYCLDTAKLKEVLAPLTSTVIIGPPSDCKIAQVQGVSTSNQPTRSVPNRPNGSGERRCVIGNGWAYQNQENVAIE